MWHTSQLQELVPVREWRFESSLRHSLSCKGVRQIDASLFCFRVTSPIAFWEHRWLCVSDAPIVSPLKSGTGGQRMSPAHGSVLFTVDNIAYSPKTAFLRYRDTQPKDRPTEHSSAWKHADPRRQNLFASLAPAAHLRGDAARVFHCRRRLPGSTGRRQRTKQSVRQSGLLLWLRSKMPGKRVRMFAYGVAGHTASRTGDARQNVLFKEACAIRRHHPLRELPGR
jgi:hypothetical protein